jgi:hypothetical protein
MHPSANVMPSRSGRTGGGGLSRAIRPGVAGLAWLLIAATSAWLVLGTPLLARLSTVYTRNEGQAIASTVIWAVALTAPAAFAALGAARLLSALGRARGHRARPSPLAPLQGRLPPGCVLVASIWLPDGRRIPNVVLGPHGVAVFEALPPAAASRRTGDRWEVRFADRTWRSIENPLDRAARDAERLRRHLEAQERDFVVRVQAAVLGDERPLTRTEGCAVVALEDVPAWLAALPTQRGLSVDRLDHLNGVLAALA